MDYVIADYVIAEATENIGIGELVTVTKVEDRFLARRANPKANMPHGVALNDAQKDETVNIAVRMFQPEPVRVKFEGEE